MGIKVLLIAIVLLLLSSCTYQKPNIPDGGKPSIFIVEEPSIKTFVVGDGNSPLLWFDNTADKRLGLNILRYNMGYQDNQKEFEIKSQFSKVVRSVDGNTIFGYLKEVDNPGFEKAKK